MKFDNFENILLEDLAWRKKEITELYLIASDNKNEVLFKSLILILYAHWEGYIKHSSKLYIKYISEEKVNICDLTYNFKALALKNNITRVINSQDNLTLGNELKFMEKYELMQYKNFKVKIDISDEFDKSIINTKDNLNPGVFKNILDILGLKYLEPFESREKYIDKNLLGNRNAIGHGSKFDSDDKNDFKLCIEDLSLLKQFILEVLDFYTNMMFEYIENKFYLLENFTRKLDYDNEKNIEFDRILKLLEKQNENNAI